MHFLSRKCVLVLFDNYVDHIMIISRMSGSYPCSRVSLLSFLLAMTYVVKCGSCVHFYLRLTDVSFPCQVCTWCNVPLLVHAVLSHKVMKYLKTSFFIPITYLSYHLPAKSTKASYSSSLCHTLCECPEKGNTALLYISHTGFTIYLFLN